jgi:NAD(P)H-hydrate repair Nnr-like enzyme with NAD(P)H-hydrate dehydratase domain
MTIRHFGSYTTARTNLRDLLDTAHTGRVTTVDRDRERFAVVDADVLRAQLAELRPSGAVVTAEGGGWSAFLPGVPVSGEGVDLDSALEDLIEALREYAADWNDRLLGAPNHRGNWALVVLTELSDDEQLKGWLIHDEMSATR